MNPVLTKVNSFSQGEKRVYNITNTSTSIVDTHLLVIVQGLSPDFQLVNASGFTRGGDTVFLPNGSLTGDLVPGPSSGDPYIRVFLPVTAIFGERDAVLLPGQSISETLVFKREGSAQLNYTLDFLSGQGTP